MSIKQQTVIATFEVDVELTEDLLMKDTEPDRYGDYNFTEPFTDEVLIEAMNKAKLDTGEYRLEIKVIKV